MAPWQLFFVVSFWGGFCEICEIHPTFHCQLGMSCHVILIHRDVMPLACLPLPRQNPGHHQATCLGWSLWWCSRSVESINSKVVVSQTFFSFYPDPWGNDPNWRAYFSDGLVQPPTRQRFCPKKLHSSQSDFGHDSVSHHFLGYVWKPSAWTFPELKECELHGCWGVVVMLSGRGPQDTATTISATTVWGGLHGVFSCGYSWETMSINAVYYIMYILKLIL